MSRRPALFFVLLCVFLDALCIGLIIPVLPRLLGVLTVSREEQAFWYGAVMVGYGLTQFLCAPILGALSDRFGRRPLLLSGILGLGVMSLVPALTSSPAALLISRILGGALSANVVVAQAYIADITPVSERAKSFGRIGAVFGLAYILGPALGGVLGDWSERLPFFTAFAVCAGNFLYGLFLVPESLPAERRKNAVHPASPLPALKRLLSHVGVPNLLGILFLVLMSQSMVQVTWSLYAEFRYAWSPMEIGLSIFALGAAITVTQALLLPGLLRHLSPTLVVRLGIFIGLASLLGVALTKNPLWGAVFLCLSAVVGVAGPVLQASVSKIAKADDQGATMGGLNSLNSFARGISPLFGTPLLLYTAGHDPASLAAGLPYFLAAALLLLALALSLHLALATLTNRDDVPIEPPNL